MHDYLKTVGFQCIKTHKQLTSLFEQIVSKPDSVQHVVLDEETDLVLFSKEFAPDMGVSVCGVMYEDNMFHPQFYFPYVKGRVVSTTTECFFYEHAEKESFAGSCDDTRINITLIFSLANFMELRSIVAQTGTLPSSQYVSFSGLSTSGKILLPLQKTEMEIEKAKLYAQKRSELLESVKSQDVATIEKMQQQELRLFHQVHMQLRKKDLYSIIDSYFMPYGVECDQYTLMGTIEKVDLVKNKWTGEEVYRLLIDCNDMPFEIAIEKTDLLGEPAVGRRFKGSVWLTGHVKFQ